MSKTGFVDGSSKETKIASIISLVAFPALILFAVYYAEYFTIDIFRRINSGSYYVEATKLGLFLIFCIPAFISLTITSILLLANRLKSSFTRKLGITMVTFASLAILSGFIMWPIINYQLDKHNYSYCFFYTGSNIMSPPVYVKDPDYCFMNARYITKDLFAWFDQQEAAGIELEPFEVKQKIVQLNEENGTDW